MTASIQEPLKILARDEISLRHLASHVQDAICPITEMAWLEQEQQFMAVITRFMWENALAEAEAENRRTLSGLCIHHVTEVQHRGLDLKQRGEMFDLLTIEMAAHEITLIFAGDRAIRLAVTTPLVTLEDLGESWPTTHRPQHDL